MSSKLISFVTSNDGETISIHLDITGIEYFMGELERLKSGLEKNECEHAHFMSSDYAGGELSNTRLKEQPEEATSVHHVKIYGWTDEWKRKHALG